MRRGGLIVIVAALCVGVVTLWAVSAVESAPRGARVVTSTEPGRLVGAWWVSGSELLDDRLMVLLPSGDLQVHGTGPCELMGGWSATASGLLALQINAASGSCGRDLAPAVAFASGIQRFLISERGLVRLTDTQGSTVAALASAGAPTDWPGEVALDGELVRALDEPYPQPPAAADLPDGVEPVPLDVLTSGRWLPVATVSSTRWPDDTRPHAQFDADGAWSGADGCNGQGGRWSMDPSTGEWLASNAGQTEIGCDNVDVASMVAAARSVGLDAGELVFYDAAGTVTGRFALDTASVGHPAG
jgi:heat shock protein HslJ